MVNWVSSPLSFFLSASTAPTYIFTAPTCTTAIITLEPCALNAEFQHFILRFNKISFTLEIPLKEGIRGESRGDRGWKRVWLLQITLIPHVQSTPYLFFLHAHAMWTHMFITWVLRIPTQTVYCIGMLLGLRFSFPFVPVVPTTCLQAGLPWTQFSFVITSSLAQFGLIIFVDLVF
jgi:hypothetical protein